MGGKRKSLRLIPVHFCQHPAAAAVSAALGLIALPGIALADGQPGEPAFQAPSWLMWFAALVIAALVVSLFANVYFRRRAERTLGELRESESLLRSIFDNVPVGLLVKRRDHTFVRFNKTYLDWYGLDGDKILGVRSEDVQPFQSAEDVAVMNAQEAAVLETGEPSVREVMRWFDDGTMHTLNITKFPIYDRLGEISRVGSVSIDLTKQIEAQKALKNSETRFREFAEVASDWFWEMDAELRFSYFSGRNQEVLGFDQSAYIGKTRNELTPEDHTTEKWRQHFDDLENHRPFRDFRYTLKTITNGELDISVSANPVFDDAGIFQGYRGVGKDISEEVKAEAALRASEAKYRAIFETSGVGMAICEMDGTLVECNDAFVEIIGYDMDEVFKLTYWDITPSEYEAQEAHQIELLEQTGSYGPYEKHYIHKDGTRVPVMLNGSLIQTGDGVNQIWSIVLDISDRTRAEGIAQNALAEAERANRAKSEFLATMSHEFRTPLNAILGFSEMLRSQYLGPMGSQSYVDYANDIHNSGEHMLALVNDVLDIAAIEAGKRELRPEPIHMSVLVEDCIRRFEKAAADGGIALYVDISDDLPPFDADERAVTQVLQNLVSNAIKFTGSGGRIEVVARVHEGNMIISVIDTGIGIPAIVLPTITQPFSQSDTNPLTTEEGTGLGLAIVESLVEAHGGRLDIESEFGEGTAVHATFPMQPPTNLPATSPPSSPSTFQAS